MTIKQFIDRHGIKFSAKPAHQNPHINDMPPGSTHWSCTFSCGRRRLTTPFSMGPAHAGEPAAENVLNCMALDASGFENAGDFEDWCAEYGFDTDSRRAERSYAAVKAAASALRRFLGDDDYDFLLHNIEEL